MNKLSELLLNAFTFVERNFIYLVTALILLAFLAVFLIRQFDWLTITPATEQNILISLALLLSIAFSSLVVRVVFNITTRKIK